MYTSQNDHDLVECPYDKTHRILRKRLQIHLLRCRKIHPDAELQKCPFNAVHLIPEPEFVHHVSTCPDRKLITQYKYDPVGEKPVEHEIIRHAKVEDEENWDDMDIKAPEFKLKPNIGVLDRRDRIDYIPRSLKNEISRSPTRSRSRSRSRSPLERYPLAQPKRERFDPSYEYFQPKREPESPPRYSYGRSRYGYHREDYGQGPSMDYTHFANRTRVKKEPTQVEFYDLDDDPYYNGGC